MSKFPQAKPVKPIYEIGGELYQRVPASEALSNPDALRAAVEIKSGPDKGGEKIGWFVKLAPAVVDVPRGIRER